MPIIDSAKDAKFDALIRTNKDSALMAFIMATDNISKKAVNNEDKKAEVAKRLKSAYELFREDIKGSNSGAGTYGDGSQDISKQFESHYTMGYEMGIWTNSNFNLSSLAKEVADYNITVSEYIGIVFLNLFTFYQDGTTYHHFLYDILKKAENTDGINSNISKELIASTLPIAKSVEQANIIFNYLIASDFFEKVDDKNMHLSRKWQGKGEKLLALCNLEYKDSTFDEVKEKFKNKEFYANYVTKKPQTDIKGKKCILLAKSIDLYELLDSKIELDYPQNRIIFGAPGTGKSYTLNTNKDDILNNYPNGNYERVTFHPNYSYGSFVGTYKPVSDGENIKYKYVPGPFMRMLAKALKNCIEVSNGKSEINPYILIIEEINRANVAAVFGEVFQLLDRDTNGVSEYAINPSEDIKKYLAEKLNITEESLNEIKIPNNMFIWATMNSADQGVFPIDTAFKRRWDFEYIGVNEEASYVKDKYIPMRKDNEGNYYYVKWDELRTAINVKMQTVNQRINEDKLLGPFFISKSSLDNALVNEERFIKLFKNKVIMYLFEDAMKIRPQEFFSGHKGNMLFSELCKSYDEYGEKIFGINNLEHYSKDELSKEE